MRTLISIIITVLWCYHGVAQTNPIPVANAIRLDIRNSINTQYNSWFLAQPPSNSFLVLDQGSALPRFATFNTVFDYTGGSPNQPISLDFSGLLPAYGLQLVAETGSIYDLLDVNDLSDVAFTGDYNDLINLPSIPADQINSDWNSVSGVSQILNKPSIPSAQIQTDWNAISGIGVLLNKPTLGSAALQPSSAFATAVQGTLADTALQVAPVTSVNGHTGTVTIVQSDISGLVAAISAKFTTPSGTTAQYVRGDGSLATLPSPGTGTVTSVTAGTGLSGGTFTTSGTVSMPNTGSAGTYANVTTDAQGRVTAGTGRSITNNTSRTIVTTTSSQGWQPTGGSTRDYQVSYSFNLSSTATIGGASSATIVIEVATTNSTTPADWTIIGRVSNGQTITLAIALQSVQTSLLDITRIIPAGSFVRARSILTGTSSASWDSGQETLL